MSETKWDEEGNEIRESPQLSRLPAAVRVINKAEVVTSTPAETVDPVAALEKIGASITRDGDGDIVTVSCNYTQLTDAGLMHLTEMTRLQNLSLEGTTITDAGLVHLKGLTNLKKLWLEETKVSDAGLVHLKEMTSLEMLWLHGTQITDAGIAELRTALPDCKVTQKAF